MQETNKKHSIIGIVSCTIGCLTFLIFLLAVVFYYLQFQNITGRAQDDALGILQMSAAMILPVPVHIFGLILGAIALFFPNRKKLFPFLGTVSNLIFGFISLFPWLWLIVGGMGRV